MKNLSGLIAAIMVFVTIVQSCSPAKTITAYDVLRPINENDLNSLQKGTTTKDMVSNTFGTPFNRLRTQDGETYIYKYFGDSLAIVFNNSNVLNRYAYRPEPFQLLFEKPSNTFRSFNDRFLKKLEPGKSTFWDLQKEFNEPTRVENGTVRQKLVYRGRNENLTAWITRADSTFIRYQLDDK